ncbi:MAG: sulfurtransferase TusA family protein [SAR324 cluster bacterium]|nr:sulfurtransferase TusA family protein [SAR324 cluster bacterium]
MAMKFEKVEDGKYVLDVCGYVCPHPQIYTKKSLEKIAEGDILKLIFDNPSSAETIIQMCEQNGNDIIEQTQEDGKIVYRIEKG